MKVLTIPFLYIFGLLALAQPVVRQDVCPLTTQTLIQWDANPEPDIVGYWVQMQTGTNVFESFTTNTYITVLTLQPLAPNGTHQFWVNAVNAAGLEGAPSEVLITNLVRAPGRAGKPRVFNP